MEGEKDHVTSMALEHRVQKLEDIVEEIRNELKQKSVSDAQMQEILKLIAQNQNTLSDDVKDLRGDMMKLVTDTLNKTREDMTMFIKIQEKNDEKEREHKRTIEQMERQHSAKTEDRTLSFNQKLIIACVSVGGTIVLAFFGVKALIPIFM